MPLGPIHVHIAVGQEGDLLARQQSGLLRPARCCRCQSPYGLDTRCERLQGYAHWYDLDLPETIAVRKKLLPEDGAVSQIAMSAMDNWGGKITQHGAPALVIIEGLTMYLSEAEIHHALQAVCAGTRIGEVMNPMAVKRFQEKSIEGSRAKFTWGIKGGAALAALLPDFRFVEAHSLTDGMAAFLPVYRLLGKLPLVRSISNKIIVLGKGE